MDTAEACKILELKTPFTLRELKKAYYNCALTRHPDRNKDDLNSACDAQDGQQSNTEQFQNTVAAYEFLTIQLELQEETQETLNIIDYSVIIKNYIHACLEITKTNIPEVIRNITEKALSGLNKSILQKILYYINNYSDLLVTNRENINIVIDVISGKLSEDNTYHVETTLDNLFQAEIFKLEVDGEIYYIPLWHNEVEYDKEGTNLIVKCEACIPDHIYIDDNNDIHVNIKASFGTLLKKTHIEFDVSSTKVFKIPVSELFIKKTQDFFFYKKGIPRINDNDMYNADHVGDIIAHITLDN